MGGMGVELVGCEGRGLGDVVGVGEGAAGEGGLAEDAPPAFLQVEPARADGDEGVVDAGMVLEPGPGGQAVVAGQVVGDDPGLPVRVGVLDLLQELLVEDAVAGGGGHGQGLAVGGAQAAVDPGFLRSAAVVEFRFDPVPVG